MSTYHHSPDQSGLEGDTAATQQRFFARTKTFARRSRELPKSLIHTMEKHGEHFNIPVQRGNGWTTVAGDFRLDMAEIFGRPAPVTLEIGSGIGEQVVAAAAAHPDRHFLALEVWQPGIAKLISRAVAAGIDNVRTLEVDAVQALPIMLADASIAEVWTFFPDPWRKARHHKRRLVSDSFALEVARVLVDGGIWRMATDWDDYAWQMRDVVESCPAFSNPYAGQRLDPEDPEPYRGGFAPRWDGRVLTRFEQRGLEQGHRVHDIEAHRIPRGQA